MKRHVKHAVLVASIWWAALAMPAASLAQASKPPEFPQGPAWVGRSTHMQADGSWERIVTQRGEGPTQLVRFTSTDNGQTWSQPQVIMDLPADLKGGGVSTIPTRDGEVQVFLADGRQEGDGKRPAIDRFIDIWHVRSMEGRTKWSRPQRVFEGYVGALCNGIEMSNGRLLLPFAMMVPGRAAAPPYGRNETVVLYSDDKGQSFTMSPARLVAPAYEGFNGSNEGACEPATVQLKDGRVVMLMRTGAGVLYESISTDGVNWPAAWPSRFHMSTGPADMIRLPDDRILMLWNNATLPPKVDGVGVYGGRDALHAVIADPTWTTFHGWREVFRDPARDASPPTRGDRGTAYPDLALMKDGRVGVSSGQGGRRTLFYVDPQWLYDSEQSDDFSNGVSAWTTYKAFGPAKNWWRDRTAGATLIDHPAKPGAKALHLRRTDDKDADGANWNFPMGRRGKLVIHLTVNPDSAGGSIALGDRMFDPSDENGERLAMFAMTFGPDAKGDRWELQPGDDNEVVMEWDTDRGECVVMVNGQDASKLPLLNRTVNGVSYLRLRSTATSIDPAGFYVSSVHVKIAPTSTGPTAGR